MGTTYFTHTRSNWVEQVILISVTKKKKQLDSFCNFVYLVNSAWGFNPEHFCNPNTAKFVSPMSVHNELNYLWLNLVAFLIKTICFSREKFPGVNSVLDPNRTVAR